MRPTQHTLVVGRQPVESVAALDDGHAELLFELADAARQRRLRDMTRLRSAREVSLAGERHEILQLTNVHRRGWCTTSQVGGPCNQAVTPGGLMDGPVPLR